jgi:hypothetical protein
VKVRELPAQFLDEGHPRIYMRLMPLLEGDEDEVDITGEVSRKTHRLAL